MSSVDLRYRGEHLSDELFENLRLDMLIALRLNEAIVELDVAATDVDDEFFDGPDRQEVELILLRNKRIVESKARP